MNTISFNHQAIEPSKIVCIGRNYVDHIKELNNAMPTEPVIFIKPNSAISDQLKTAAETIHYEAEITFMVQQEKLAGVGLGLDLTKRGIQSQLKTQGLPWERAKAFDGSAVFSQFVDIPISLNDLRLELDINQQLVQSGGYELMLYKPEALLNEVKTFMTLEDGDLLMTGTPKGVGSIQVNDKFTARLFNHNQLLLEKNWTVR